MIFNKKRPQSSLTTDSSPTAEESREPGGIGIPGTMQDWPLTVDKILDYAKINHPEREVVTARAEGGVKRTNYAALHARAKQVSAALASHGVSPGDRIATLAWNTAEHMECWFGTMGVGAVLHTMNPRLHPDQIAWIANHAEDRILAVDAMFAPIIKPIADKLQSVERLIVFGDLAAFDGVSIPAIGYEDWINGQTVDTPWGGFPETTACGLCYTSGTTGDPKGVAYTHRSNVLHTYLTLAPDALGLSQRDTVLPIVPMFHANAWGLAFSCPAAGAKMVMPGPRLDGESVYNLLNDEQVTVTAAVPTVWLGLLQYLQANGGALPHLQKVVIGGSAVPEKILRAFEEDYGVRVLHAWGMTELSPLGSVNVPPSTVDHLSNDELLTYKLKQGRAPFGVELKIVDDHGAPVERDGKTSGRLLVRGPAVASGYFKGAGGQVLDGDGFLDTGDVANIDQHGTMQITDRAKDVIKSGGEWISSVDLENYAVGHPKIANAAAIGIAHPKWDERPLLIVQPQAGESLTKEDVLAQLEGKIAKWWMPDDVVFVDDIPLGATGKINKVALREQFKDHRLPTID